MKNSLGFLKCFLWSICAFHVIVGLGLNFFPQMPQIMAGIYGATVDWTPQFIYILKPLGAFMLVLGIMAGIAALNPLTHRTVIYGFVILFFVRALQRLIYQSEILNAFSIVSGRNMFNMTFFFGMAVVLFILSKNAEKGA